MKLKCFTLYGIVLVYMIYFLSALCKLGETSLTLLNLYEAREYCNRFGKELSLNVDDVSNQTFPVWINAVNRSMMNGWQIWKKYQVNYIQNTPPM